MCAAYSYNKCKLLCCDALADPCPPVYVAVCRDFSVNDVVTTAGALRQSKLQSTSVACGRVHVPKANSAITLSVAGTADDNSTECQQAAQLVHDGKPVIWLLVLPASPISSLHCKSSMLVSLAISDVLIQSLQQ